MASPIMNQKALDGITSIITAEVISNLQAFINQVSSLSKQSKKIQEIIDTISSNIDDDTQNQLTAILKRQNNEISIINERVERNKLPKCTIPKKNGEECGKACKSGHTKNDKYVCDEHFKQLESYRDEKCCYPDCGDCIKKTTNAIDIQGELDGISYAGKFLCAKHTKKVVSSLQKLNNPCKFMIQSKNGERMCCALAVSDERCKKHLGKDPKKKGSKKDEDKKSKKGSKKEEEPKKKKGSNKEDAPKKKGSKKEEEPVEDAPKKKGSKKEDTPVTLAESDSSDDEKAPANDSEEVKIDVNFIGKRPLKWIFREDEEEGIYIDANSGLVAVNGDDDVKMVYAIWDPKSNSVENLTDAARKYANKHKLDISE